MDKNRPKIHWGEALVPGLGLLFGVGYFLQSLDAPKQALLWPTLTALTVLVFWVPIVVKFVFRKDAPAAKIRLSWLWRDGQRTGLITAATLGYLVLVPFLGFSISNFIFMLAVFRGLGSRQWKTEPGRGPGNRRVFACGPGGLDEAVSASTGIGQYRHLSREGG